MGVYSYLYIFMYRCKCREREFLTLTYSYSSVPYTATLSDRSQIQGKGIGKALWNFKQKRFALKDVHRSKLTANNYILENQFGPAEAFSAIGRRQRGPKTGPVRPMFLALAELQRREIQDLVLAPDLVLYLWRFNELSEPLEGLLRFVTYGSVRHQFINLRRMKRTAVG